MFCFFFNTISTQPDYDNALKHLASPAPPDPPSPDNRGGKSDQGTVEEIADFKNNSILEGSFEEIGGGNTWKSDTQTSLRGTQSGILPDNKRDDTTNRIDLFTSGAYDNFETVTSALISLYVPPPKVVTTTTKYKLFRATTDLE